MRATGIICEFNPFHNGHKYLIDNARQALKPDAVVCVMSGDFMQRGEPALWNKYTRAEMAVRCGADIVIELPVCFALNAAKEFARGGVTILKKLGVVDSIAFGSECGDVNIISTIAKDTAVETPEFSKILKGFLDTGISYPAAYQSALKQLFLHLNDDFFMLPNNTLALEYLRQNVLLDAGLRPYTILRNGAAHDELDTCNQYASGKRIRDIIIQEGDITNNYEKYVPDSIKDLISENVAGTDKLNDVLFDLIRYKIMTSDPEEIAQALEVSEGLEHKIKKEVINANSLDDLILKVKSKRYTYARISRVLLQLLIGLNKDPFLDNPDITGLKVLAFNNKGRELMNEVEIKGSLNLYTNIKRHDLLTQNDYYLNMNMKASDIYNVLNSKNIYRNNDMVCNSIYCNI